MSHSFTSAGLRNETLPSELKAKYREDYNIKVFVRNIQDLEEGERRVDEGETDDNESE